MRPELRKMNDQFAVIEVYGGDCVIMVESQDPLGGRPQVNFQSFDAFKRRFLHKRIDVESQDGKIKSVQVAEWWLHQERRRQYREVVFAPGKDVLGCYNLWRGYGAKLFPATVVCFSNIPWTTYAVEFKNDTTT